jgi:ketosteroid isomerase-like protein
MHEKILIRQARDEWVSAFNREALEELGTFCTGDVVLIPPNQPAIHGAEAAVEYWRIGFTASRSRLQVQSRELYVSGEWAFEWFDWTIRLVPLAGGTPLEDQGHAFWIWRRDHGETWRIARAMWNSSHEVPSLWAGGWAHFPEDGFPRLMAPMW